MKLIEIDGMTIISCVQRAFVVALFCKKQWLLTVGLVVFQIHFTQCSMIAKSQFQHFIFNGSKLFLSREERTKVSVLFGRSTVDFSLCIFLSCAVFSRRGYRSCYG